VRPIRKFVIATGLVLTPEPLAAWKPCESHRTERIAIRAAHNQQRPQSVPDSIPAFFARRVHSHKRMRQPSTSLVNRSYRQFQRHEKGEPLTGTDVAAVALKDEIPPRRGRSPGCAVTISPHD
jgi:hypothetical protein